MIYEPHQYQAHAIQHIINNLGAGLFLDMGLGKTSSTLTAIDILLNQYLEVSKVLIIAPKRVARDTWTAEAEKWDHLNHLKFSLVLGTERQRKEALKAKADIYVINRENVVWLVGLYATAFPFDMVVVDESSSFKSAKSARFKALRKVRPLINRTVALTGTPRPNSLMDLWSQLYLLDKGERLGVTLTGYREKYFKEGKKNGHVVYDYSLQEGDGDILGKDIFEKEIFDKISDICISMKAEDYLQLPERVDITVPVKFSAEVQNQYNDFEKEQVLMLSEIEEITAVNAAGLTNKLLQFANGAIYDANKNYHIVHDFKLEALAEDIEAANGQPMLIFYSYKHDLERMMKYLKVFKPRLLESSKDISDWNNRKVHLMMAHPASAGHGLNLQQGGNNIEWFGVPWGLELYQQACARLHRQGQVMPVYNRRLIAVNTMDEDVLSSLENKAHGQNRLMDAVKARIKKYQL